jgi:hypothetical protein
MLLRLLAIALALLAAPAWSQDAERQQLARVNAALAVMSNEQAAVYQQFQMVQEMRRNEERRNSLLPNTTYGSQPANFDDVQRAEDARAQRIVDLAAESDRLYARYRELEEQKRGLIDTLSALAQQAVPLAVPPALLAPDGTVLPVSGTIGADGTVLTAPAVVGPNGAIVSPAPLPTPGALAVPGVTPP